jgi:hypothetical protein
MSNLTKKLIINAFVLPHIYYASPFLSTCSKKIVTLISRRYTQLIKVLFSLHRLTPTEYVYNTFNIDTINQILNKSLFKLSHDIYNSHLPLATISAINKPSLTSSINNRTLNFVLHHNIISNNFIFKAKIKWNALDAEIKCLCLKKFLSLTNIIKK